MIYCVEDDENILNLETYTLGNSSLPARGFSRAGDFQRALESELPDLVVLDIMLPDKSGLEILRSLRANIRTSAIPVILVTAKDSEYDKVLGLDSGADDYLAKPFGLMEFVSRVKALLRRTTTSEDSRLSIGNLELDPARRLVRISGEPVELTMKEFDLLCLLMRRYPAVVQREEIITSVWGYETESETRTVDVHVQTLRHKLGPCGSLIRTVRGIGYKMETAE